MVASVVGTQCARREILLYEFHHLGYHVILRLDVDPVVVKVGRLAEVNIFNELIVIR